MKYKTLLLYLILPVLLIVTETYQAQTVIREKVILKQTSKLNSNLKVNTVYNPLVFGIGGPRSYSYSLSGPGGSVSGTGGDGQVISENIPPVNGVYHLSITSHCECNTNIGFWVTWLDPAGNNQWIYGYEMWFNGQETRVDSFSLTSIPPEPPTEPCDFDFSLNTYEICDTTQYISPYMYLLSNVDCITQYNVTLSVQSSLADVIIYNKNTKKNLGTSATLYSPTLSNYKLKLNTRLSGVDTAEVYVKIDNGSVERSDTFSVLPENDLIKFVITAYPQEMTAITYGEDIAINVQTGAGRCIGEYRPIPPQTKYNAKIIQGMNYGTLLYWDDDNWNEIYGNELTNLSHYNGNFEIFFWANGDIPERLDTIIVQISTTDPGIDTVDVKLRIKPSNLLVQPIPAKIAPGETADIILKQRSEDGTLTDLPPGYLLDCMLREGDDYGTLYIPEFGDTSDYAYNVTQGFKFIAYEGIPDSVTVQSLIFVQTHMEVSPGKIIPFRDTVKTIPLLKLNKNRHLSKTQSTLDYEILSGYGIVTITNTSKKLYYVKASFDKDTLYAGDIANVILTRVDEEGNESNFPESTLFEVGLIEGCDVGKIVVNGNVGDFFSDVQRPIMFVVNDTLSVDSAKVILRAGVNSDDSTTYIPYVSARIVGANNDVPVSAKIVGSKSVKVANEACSTQQVQTDGFGDADAQVNKSKYKLEIIYPKKDSKNEEIDKSPLMPIVNCKAKLKNYDKGEVTYEWEYWVSYTISRHTTKGDSLCPRKGKIEFIGNSTAINDAVTEWEVPFIVENIKYIELKARQPEIPGWPAYKGDCDETIGSWNYGRDVFIGGDVYVRVTAKNSDGKELAVGTVNANKILGDNPEPDDVYLYAGTNEVRAILKHESRTMQFKPTPGWPNYGSPNGFGLMQLDNPAPIPTEIQLWNWKQNLDGGIQIFNNVKKEAKKHLDRFKQEYADSILLMNAYQNYNFGNQNFYHTWNKEKEDWEILPYIARKDEKTEILIFNNKNNYGGKVYEIYKKLNN